MTPDSCFSHITRPAQLGRESSFSAGLASLGEAAFGRPAAVACSGMIVTSQDIEVLGPTGQPCSEKTMTSVEDPVLEAMGLQLVQIEAQGEAAEVVAIPALMLRIGLLGRILDVAYAHLKGRTSMGRKTLSQQLVKVEFADAYATMQMMSEIALLKAETGDFFGLAEDHSRLTTATIRAEKLMGGHGFLMGGTHPIGYLSMLLQVIYGPRQ